MSVNLSRSQILNFVQCPRRFWLEQYHPENEGDVAPMDAYLDAEEAIDATARACFEDSEVTRINGRLGLRKAIEQTRASLRDGAVLLDATFEFEGISAQVDILDWNQSKRYAITVSAAATVEELHLDDCALQAWIMRNLDLPEHRFFVALQQPQPTAAAAFDEQFALQDISEQVYERIDRYDSIVHAAREQHASLDEPDARVGSQCEVNYACPFLEYCGQQPG